MKILIIYASAGQGHKRCAEAIFDSIRQNTSHQVSIIDALGYTNFLFKFFYTDGYAFLITHFPSVWRFFYSLTDNPASKPVNSLFLFFNKNLNSIKLRNYIKKENPEFIISTHFFANEVISNLKKENLTSSKLICVITDYLAHYFWLSSGVGTYVVASQASKKQLIEFGISEDKIKIMGIPVDERFSQMSDKNEICQRLNLSPSEFSVLVVTGAFGFSLIERIVDLLAADAQLLVICGNNKKLLQRLSGYKAKANLKAFGMINNMHELMAVADVIITKPGGLTISEALAKNLPMIFISAIPGQETNNAQFFNEQGLGVIVQNLNELKAIIRQFKNDKDYLGQFKMRLAQFPKTNAAKEILTLLK